MRTRTRRLERWQWLAWSLAVLAGCQGVSVWRVVGPRVRSVSSRERVEALVATSEIRPDGRLEAARASHAAALGAERASRETAAHYELDAIVDAAAELNASPPPSAPGQAPGLDEIRALAARGLYNAALENFLRLTGGRRIHPDAAWKSRLAASGVLVFDPGPGEGGHAAWAPSRFDDLLFAADFSVRGMEHQFRTDGVGVPMIAVRHFEPNRRERESGQDRFLMPREVYPVTALVVPVRRPGELAPSYRLELRDPIAAGGRSDTPPSGGWAIATDLTTPLAYHLARSPLPILQEVGLLDPGWLEDLQGLYMLHPYRPGRIPIVFVHGLRSSPLAWLKVINDVRGDPVLRERYQVWLYMYPTGKPLPSTAARLRRDLAELRATIDPDHGDPTLDRMVLIGHSMGGLISKMMILESGDAIWRLFSNRPFDELQGDPDRREQLRRSLFFSPVPSVARIVFIATPHRGSALGDELIGRITDRLIRLPRTLRSAYRTLMANNDPSFFTPMLRGGIPTSIAELGLDNPFLTTLSQLPRTEAVPVHSIIGRKNPDTPLEQSSDGVVPYMSSHIDWAESELVVTGNHVCQDLPDTIREILRILHLHLGEDEKAPLPLPAVPALPVPPPASLRP